MNRFALPLFLLAALAGSASAKVQEDVIARADARVHEIGDASAYVDEVQRSITMAKRGDYGPIGRNDLRRAEAAQQEIEILLAGRDNAAELDTDDRVALLNAQELITAILRSDEKGRKICKRVANTGSRLGKTECMTVAQREKLATQASRDMREIQRLNCRPGAPLEGTELGPTSC